MSHIRITRVGLTLVVQVPEVPLEQHLAASAAAVGRKLAEQVQTQVRRERLGYFPALDYFRDREGVEPELLQAAHDIAWFAGQWATGEIRRRLRGVFSSVTVQSQQPCAFLLPTVRPRDPQALDKLASHLTPDRLRLQLAVALLQRGDSDSGFDTYARRQVMRFLEPAFSDLEVADVRML